MPRFRLREDHPAVILAELDAFNVEPGGLVEVPGDLVTVRPKPKDDEPAPPPIPDDAYLVANNGVERAWPKAVWELADKPAAPAAPSVKEK